MYVLATLLTLSLRLHQITNINQRASSTLPLRFWCFDYVTTSLPLRSWRLDCVTTTLLLRSWRLSYVHGDLQHARANQGINTSPVLALSSLLNVNLSNPHQRTCHFEREEKQTLLVLPPSLRQLNRSKSLLQKMLCVRSNRIYPIPNSKLNFKFIIAICSKAIGTIRFIFFVD